VTGRPIRIGFVLTAVWEGGLERFTCELIDAMDRREFQPHLYVLTSRNPWLEEFHRRQVPTRIFQGANAPNLRSLPSLAGLFPRLARDMRKDRLDIVHTCDFLPAAIGRLASRAAGIPSRMHTLHSMYDWHPRWTHPLNRWLSAITDRITAVSLSVAEQAVSQGIDAGKIEVVLNGADTSRFRPLPEERAAVRAELGLSESDILVGSVGSLTTRKAHHLLVQAAGPLLDADPRLHVSIFGAANGGPQDNLGAVRDAIAATGHPDRIRIHPPRPDVERLQAAFDVHCMPSIVEGLSLASVEAQLCGALSVLSDIGPFREVVEDGRTGFLFRSGDPDHLRLTLSRALALGPDAASIRQAAREDALRRFDRSRMVARYLDLYRMLAASKEP